MTPQFIFSNTMKFKTPIGAVCTFCRVSSSANKNSFHEKMNDKIAVEAMPGVAKGIEILNRVCKSEQPSMRAASSRLIGISSIKALRLHTMIPKFDAK